MDIKMFGQITNAFGPSGFEEEAEMEGCIEIGGDDVEMEGDDVATGRDDVASGEDNRET